MTVAMLLENAVRAAECADTHGGAVPQLHAAPAHV